MAHTEPFHAPEPDEVYAPGVEPDHINVRAILGFGIGLAVVAALAHVAMLGMYWMLDRQHVADQPARVFPMAADEDARRPPEPRLQGGVHTDNAGRLVPEIEDTERNAGPKEALRELRGEEDQILGSYSWVDRNAKVVHIPIDQAMKLTLQRGLPARQQSGEAAQPSATAARGTSGSSTSSGQEQGK
jgi:hypothetical protein